MTELNRREFVRAVGAATPIAVTPSTHKQVCRAPLVPSRPLDAKLLQAMGQAILPSELGVAGVARVVAEFQRWLREYTPGAEALHPYGMGEIRRLPDNPAQRWEEQLTYLDRAAKQQFAQEYALLDVTGRQSLVRDAIADDELDRLPSALNARHVALGLLGHFYASPEAANLCHQAEINPYACRPLSDSPTKPNDRTGSRGDS